MVPVVHLTIHGRFNGTAAPLSTDGQEQNCLDQFEYLISFVAFQLFFGDRRPVAR